MLTSAEIRQQFLAFFEGKGHTIVDSSPVMPPPDDPSLKDTFTNAGMNQFKDVFLGTGRRNYVRAANTQKCIRAGGKHNDLDDVGQDTYHHTFFEMLGNWSFGDYFKREAIAWAWELLTEVWGIDKSRLYATVFEGNEADGLPPDTEAQELWKEVTDIDPSHVTRWGKKDNFWEMGDTGPCGPCSEIHIDLTPDKSGASLVNAGDPRVIELWNLVFIQYNRAPDGKLTPLSAKHVDTGLGFERLCAVLQGMESGDPGSKTNYDTDVFASLFEAIRKRTGAPKYTGTLPERVDASPTDDPSSEPRTSVRADSSAPEDPRELKFAARKGASQEQVMIDVTYRVIADHVRCLTFALTDGAIPDNEGRGYVLRRILRRAVRYGRQCLNMHEPFMCELVAPLIDNMADAFPELRTAHSGKNVEHVTELIRDEEASFLKTVGRGIDLLEVAIADEFCKTISAERNWSLMISGLGLPFMGDYIPEVRGAHGPDDYVFWFKNANEDDKKITLEKLDRQSFQQETTTDITIPGAAAFKLHDTDGFPIDLTVQMAEERGLTVNIGEYERLMEESRRKARSATKQEFRFDASHVQRMRETRFVGYEGMGSETYALHILKSSPTEMHSSEMHPGDRGALVLSETPFYAEQGGQVGDKGSIRGSGQSWEFVVHDTQKLGGVYLHYGACTTGTIISRTPPQVFTKDAGDPYFRKGGTRHEGLAFAEVNPSTRISTMQNHTSTHVLNWALRDVLGEHVQQKGSLVDPEKTRFDFSNRSPLTDEQIVQVEQLCREQIDADHQVYTQEVDQAEAREINTLRAVFGEKYPDVVRVVSIGVPITEEDAKKAGRSDWLLKSRKNEKWMKYSVEFCGGTHVLQTDEYRGTGQIERFVLISEEGVAKGVRRVVGISGDKAEAAATLGEAMVAEVNARVQKPGDDLTEWLATFQKNLDEAEIQVVKRHQIRDALVELQKVVKQRGKKQDAAAGGAVMETVATLLESAEEVGGVTIVVGEVPQAPADQVRGSIDWVRQKCEASAVLLAMAGEGRVTLLAGMSKKAVERGLKAGDLIREVAPIVGGKGGGKPDLAQGGGKDPSKIPDALDRAKSWLKSELR